MKINRNDVIVAACHQAWYSYAVLGLGEHGEPFGTAPKGQKRRLANGVEFWDTKMKELNLERAPENDVVRVLSPLSHMNWCDKMVEDGWHYGPTKDPEEKTHPCLTEYDKLPEPQKKKDEVVIRAYLAVRTAMGEFQQPLEP